MKIRDLYRIAENGKTNVAAGIGRQVDELCRAWSFYQGKKKSVSCSYADSIVSSALLLRFAPRLVPFVPA